MAASPPHPWFPPGTVILAGAGPGDPDLLTVAAERAIRQADVVVHDALVSEEILALIPRDCELVFAGKRGGSPSTSQGDISLTLVNLAREGKRVLRLKGGDPFVFGRGGEEAQHLAREKIPFRVIPGLTAGVAGPAYAGIPITHRGVNANVAFITGHEKAENTASATPGNDTRVDWEGVARSFPVIVLYMAIKSLDPLVRRLIAAGRDPETPVAVIRWATTPRQQTLVTTLERVAADVAALDLQAPAIVVVGGVVPFRQELAWFADETLIPPPSH
ncbi:MAG: uroporphyrinogen-III C-methyltransferase [Magnetococcales bacterium]|nr:uroporphyrinogen-III C-methyltransferase [Magnetococcales bacterium]